MATVDTIGLYELKLDQSSNYRPGTITNIRTMSAFETGAHHSNQEVAEHPRPLHAQSEDAIVGKQEEQKPAPLNYLEPNIPAADFNVDFSAIVGSEDTAEKVRIEKRKSNLSKLNEENEKLRRELKALSAKLEAAERWRQQPGDLE